MAELSPLAPSPIADLVPGFEHPVPAVAQHLLSNAEASLGQINVGLLTLETDPIQEAMARTRASLERFSAIILPRLQTGEATKTYFAEMVVVLNDPERIAITTDRGESRFLAFNSLSGTPATELSDAHIEVGLDLLSDRFTAMKARFTDANIVITDEDLRELIIDWNIWHELGHGLQESYETVAPRAEETWSSTPNKSNLDADTIRAGIVEKPATKEEYISRIERERFAEGFAQMTVALKLAESQIPGIDPKEVIGIMRDYRTDRAALKPESAHQIGYSTAHDPIVMQTILDKIGIWEKTPELQRV